MPSDFHTATTVLNYNIIHKMLHLRTIYTGVCLAVVNVHIASDSSETSLTVAGKIVDFVEARP